MRFVRLVPLVLAGVLLFPSHASAHVSRFEINAALASCFDQECTQLNWDFVRGIINCTPGETWRVEVTFSSDPTYRGWGVETGVCNGKNQVWEVELTKERGVGSFENICANGRATTKFEGSIHDTATTSQFCS